MTKRDGSWWDTQWPGVVLAAIALSVIMCGIVAVLLGS